MSRKFLFTAAVLLVLSLTLTHAGGDDAASRLSNRNADTTTAGVSATTIAAVYNVRTYGAKGDGVTDDSSAIYSATQALVSSNTGGTLYFPAGRYYIAPNETRTTALMEITNTPESATARFSITGDAYESTVLLAANQQVSLITAFPAPGVANLFLDINGIDISYLMAGVEKKKTNVADTPMVSAISLQGVSQSTIDSIQITATGPISTPFAAIYIGANCSNVLVEDSQLSVIIESDFGPSVAQASAVRVAANTDQIQLNRLSIGSDIFSSVNGIEVDKNAGLVEINLPIFTNLVQGSALNTVDDEQAKDEHQLSASNQATVLMSGAVAKNVLTCVNIFHPLLINITKSTLNCTDYGIVLSSAAGVVLRLDTSTVHAAVAIYQASGELSLFSNQISHSNMGLNVALAQPWDETASLNAQGNTFQAISPTGVDVNIAGVGLTGISLVNNQCLDPNGTIVGSGSCAAGGCTITGNQGCTVISDDKTRIAEF